MPSGEASWTLLVVPFKEVPVIVPTPGLYSVTLEKEGDVSQIGSLEFVYIPAPPLTEERISAIKANPSASKAVRLELKCNACGDSARFYGGLERLPQQESQGWKWYQDLPDSMKCRCGAHEWFLKLYRENLHGLLGRETAPEGELNFLRLYERHVLQDVCINFETLLNSDPREEHIQKFFEKNPILLHQFIPDKIFFKAPILSKYVTDITILAKSKELLLVEIESPSTGLIRGSDGAKAAPLEHAISQVRDWLYECENHRQAALSCIGLDNAEVSAIKGLVIAGRDHPYKPEHLIKLKWEDLGRINLLTYDDVLAGLVGLARTLHHM